MMPRPDILVRGGDIAHLTRTVTLSAIVHGVAIGLLFWVPAQWSTVSRPITSYSVEIVTADRIGGTNLPRGSGGKAARPADGSVAVPAAPAAPVPAPVIPVPNAQPGTGNKDQSQPDKAKASAPMSVPPAQVAKGAVPKPVAPAAPPPVVAAAPQKDSRPGAASDLAEKPATVAKVPGRPADAKASLGDFAKKVEKDRVETGAQEPPREANRPTVQRPEKSKAGEKPASLQRSEQARATGPSVSPTPVGESEAAREEARKRDQAILAAIQRRAASLGEQGGVAGGSSGTGPLSVGPGSGSGGTVRGVEYLLYYNRMMTRIKESWAWAGGNRALEAVVAFRITPEGEIVEVRTVRSSGDPTYDRSVERAVLGAGPLGPPPEMYRDEFTKGVEITFRAEDLRS